MKTKQLEKIREFLNQPDDVYEEAPAIALELLAEVDELRGVLRELIKEVDPGPVLCRLSLLDALARARRLLGME